MATSRKSSQSQSTTTTNTNTEEKTMTTQNTANTNTQNITTNNVNYFQIITATGRKVAIPELSAYKVLAVCKIAVDQYARKAAEKTIGKGTNVRDKNEESIKYDKKMYNRMLIMQAFIKKVLEGVELPDSSDDALIDQLNNL